MEIRNIAIIAHVDHGKTALTDKILEFCGMREEGVSMDNNALEMERGITIYAKNTSVFYRDTKINIVDTPGHADFGSEVERVLRSVDSVLLIVDAQEGPMPQTRFVLKKSLDLGLKPILVLNKIDKPGADIARAHDEVFELFMELGATDEQLDFTTIYTIGRDGLSKKAPEDEWSNMSALLDVVLEKVPAAENDTTKPFRMQPFNLAYDNFLGRLGVGRVYEGIVKNGQNVTIKKPDGTSRTGKITKLFTFEGIKRIDAEQAVAGNEYDGKYDQCEIFADDFCSPELITCHSEYKNPYDSSYYIVKDEFFVFHCTDAGYEWSKCSDDGNESADDDCLSAVFFVKLVSLVQMFLLDELDLFSGKKSVLH
jgi:GTP-binding protein